MNAFPNPALAHAVGLGLLHSLWQDTLIAIALALALRAIDRRSAALRHGLACLGLVLMIAVPSLTAWASYRPLEPAAGVTPSATVEALALTSRIAPAQVAAAPMKEAGPVRAELPGSALSWIALAWLIGVAFSGGRLFLDAVGVQRLARRADAASEDWQIRLDRLARRIGVRPMVRLLRSAQVGVPCAIGWLRPVILVPVSAFTGLTPPDLELVLAHELAHIARGDFALNLAQRICEALLFFHPAAHWVSAVIRTERESCCDDVAVRAANSPVAYARALTELEALRIDAPAFGFSSRATVSALGGSLTDRVKRLVLPPARHGSGRVAGLSALTVLGTLAVVASLAVGPVAHARPEIASPAAVKSASSSTASAPSPAPLPRRTARVGDRKSEPATPAPSRSRARSPTISVAPAPAPVAAPALPFTPLPAPLPAPAPSVALAAPPPTPLPTPAPALPMPPLPPEPPASSEHPSRVEQLVQLKEAGVTPDYVRKIRAAGLDPTTRELVMLARTGVSPEQIEKLDAALGTRLDAHRLAMLSQLGVTPEFIQSLRALGLKDLDLHRLVAAKSVGLDPKYVKGLRAVGISPKDLEALVQLRAMGVDPDYVAELRKAGLVHLDPHMLAQLRALGVDGDYISRMKRLGLGALDVHQLGELRAMGVTPGYVESLRKAGLAHLKVEQLVRLRASGVDGKFVQDMNKASSK